MFINVGKVGMFSDKNSRTYDVRLALGSKFKEGWDTLWTDSLTVLDGKASAWRSGGSGLLIQQTNEALRPLYSSDGLAGGPCLIGDGVGISMAVNNTGNMPIGSEPSEIWSLCSQDVASNDASGRVLFGYGNGAAAAYRDIGRGRVSNPSSHFRVRASGTTTTNLTGSGDSFFGPSIVRARIEGNKLSIWVNRVLEGELEFTLSGTTNTRTRLFGQSNSTGSLFWNGKCASVYVTDLLDEIETDNLWNHLLVRGGYPELTTKPELNLSNWVIYKDG